jgi:hypothetical protein
MGAARQAEAPSRAGYASRKSWAKATERAWLEAAAARCPDYSEPQKYVAAMRTLAARFPDDPDAQALFAESLVSPYDGGATLPAANRPTASKKLSACSRRALAISEPSSRQSLVHPRRRIVAQLLSEPYPALNV